MQLHDPCAVSVLRCIDEALKTKKTVSFNDVMAASECKKYSISEIGKALELLRRNGLVKATSRFGCRELLEFTATGMTDAGKEFLKKR